MVVGFALRAGGGLLHIADLALLAAIVCAAFGYALGGRAARTLGGWQSISWSLAVCVPLLLPMVPFMVPSEPATSWRIAHAIHFVGGESGPGARPMVARWVRNIRRQCREARVPLFFKQWGGVFKKQAGRTLDGRIYNQLPVSRVA